MELQGVTAGDKWTVGTWYEVSSGTANQVLVQGPSSGDLVLVLYKGNTYLISKGDITLTIAVDWWGIMLSIEPVQRKIQLPGSAPESLLAESLEVQAS